jgi:hypothetical protein
MLCLDGCLPRIKALKALIELKGARQKAGELRRRWFTSPDMDLIAWYGEDDSIVGLELYYDKDLREHVFIWQSGRGYTHLAVDDGEQKPVLEYKEAPILVPDGRVDPNRIIRLFEGSCEKLPSEVVALVREKVMQHPGYVHG